MTKSWPPATVGGQPTCRATHWSLPIVCAQPRAHRDSWHSGWTAQSGTPGRQHYRWRHTIGATELMVGKVWQRTSIPGPHQREEEKPVTQQPQPLAERIETALRDAAYDCDGTCGMNERECDAEHPIQVAVLHHGEIATVYGDVDALAAVVAAVVEPELDAQAAQTVRIAQQATAEEDRLRAEIRRLTAELATMTAEHTTTVQQTWQQAADRVATELASIDPVEWAFAGQHTRNDAIQIARAVGARCDCPATGKPGHYIDHLTGVQPRT